MKLWMRVYMLTLPLTLAVLLGIGVGLIRASHDQMMEREYARALGEHAMLVSALTSYVDAAQAAFAQDRTLRERALAVAVSNYGRYYTHGDAALRIAGEDGQALFEGMADEEWNASGLSPVRDGSREYVVRNVSGRSLLYVSGWVDAAGWPLKVDYLRDISAPVGQIRAFARWISLYMLGASAVLGLGLYLLTSAALRPIKRLTAHSRALVAGAYDARIEVGQGEVGELARALNELAGAVESRIGELESAASDRDMFIANLAHEMKTPMTTILGYADLLERARLSEAQRAQALGAIRLEGARLEALSHKLLELFRLRAGDVLDIAPTDIPALLERVRASLALRLERVGQALLVDAGVQEYPLDADLTHALLMNLVENAIKASQPGGEIRLTARSENEGMSFEVTDSGSGIDQDDIERVTQPFYMADKARSRAQSGAGLGLTLCEAIAQAHGGHMQIFSQPGKGTRVKVILTDCLQLDGRLEIVERYDDSARRFRSPRAK